MIDREANGSGSDGRRGPEIASALWSLFLGALLAFVMHALYWNLGAFGDEGSYCTLGQEMLHGHLPYRDYFNEKMPLQYVWTAAVMSVSTTGIPGTRLAAALSLTGVFAILVHRLRPGLPRWGMWPWMLLCVVVCAGMWGYKNTAESSLALLFGAAAVLMTPRAGSERSGDAVVLGVIHGLAIGFRQTSVIAALVIFASPWIAGRRAPFALGASAALLAWIALMAAIGVQPSDLAAVLLFHVGSDDAIRYFRGIYPNEAVWVLTWIAAVGTAVLTCADRRRAAWTAACLLALAVPFFARMDAFRLWPSTVAAAVMFFPWVLRARFGARTIAALIASAALLYSLDRPSSFEHASEIATYIRTRTGPEHSIWVAPWSPNVYCLSGRESATRFYFLLPWIAKEGVKAEILRDLQRNAPEFIVDVSRGRNSLPQMLPGLQDLLAERYAPPIRTPRATYYRLRHEEG